MGVCVFKRDTARNKDVSAFELGRNPSEELKGETDMLPLGHGLSWGGVRVILLYSSILVFLSK